MLKSGDSDNLTPRALADYFIFASVKSHFDLNGLDSESILGFGHEISYYTFVGLTLVNLPELFHALEFYAAAVLQHILQLLRSRGDL